MMVQEMMQEMLSQCCGDDFKPYLFKMKMFMENGEEQDFSEEELGQMCQITRFYFENNFRGPDGSPDAMQMQRLFKDCGCCSES